MIAISVDHARQDAIAVRASELLTVKEYADMTRQHVESVRRRIRQGRQRGAVRVDGQWRIDTRCAIGSVALS